MLPAGAHTIDCRRWGAASLLAVIALASSASRGPASAQDALEKCRAEARPQVVACMQGKQGSGDRAANLTQCRDTVGAAAVRACMQREQQKAAAPPSRAAPPV